MVELLINEVGLGRKHSSSEALIRILPGKTEIMQTSVGTVK